jgi:peptidyl-prolyl cis-trans isomerase SurA
MAIMPIRSTPGPKVLAAFVPLLLYLLAAVSPVVNADEELDSIVAVVNDEVITHSQLEREVNLAIPQLQSKGTPLPPRPVLERQVLDRLVLQRLELQRAKQLGISVDDATLTQALTNIAQRNGLTLDNLAKAVEAQGMNFEEFRKDTRNQILISRLQAQEVVKNIQVTDQEIDRFLAKDSNQLLDRSEVRLSHILIAVPDGASKEVVAKAEQKAKDLVKRLRAGADFAQLARRYSDGRQAAEGGDLGWFKMSEVPTLVQDVARTLAKGQVSEPLRSPSGFHIIKLTDVKYAAPEVVTQTHARQILIRTNELVSDAEAKRRLEQLRMRIVGGADFATLARANSDDKGSALKGGDLGWLNPGDTVPEFQKQMDQLAPGQISEPFKTSFGWHIVQVIERRREDTTKDLLRIKARELLRERKAQAAIDRWLQRLRDEAYVQIRLPGGDEQPAGSKG